MSYMLFMHRHHSPRIKLGVQGDPFIVSLSQSWIETVSELDNPSNLI